MTGRFEKQDSSGAGPWHRQAGPALETGPCPVCLCRVSRRFMAFQPPDIPQSFGLARCPACGTVRVDPRPNRAEIKRYFSRPELYRHTTDPEGRKRSLLAERDNRLREYGGYIKRIGRKLPGGRVLDIGSGTGLFLEMLGSAYQRTGLEINALAAEYANSRITGEIRCTDAETEVFPQGSFDLIALMQTLDHLAGPGAMLLKIKGLAGAGGPAVAFRVDQYRRTGGPVVRGPFFAFSTPFTWFISLPW